MAMRLTWRGRRALILRHAGQAGSLAAMAILRISTVASCSLPVSPSPHHIAAVRTAGEARLLVDLWLRGEEAVYLERQGPAVVSDRRCLAGTLSEWWPTGRVVRELADERRCYELATDALLGFVRAAQGPDFAPAGEPEAADATTSTFKARDASAHLRTVVVDRFRQMSLRAEFRNGDLWTWTYLAPAADSPPPPPDEPARTETYTDLTPEAAAPELGLVVVPMTVADRPLLAVFRIRLRRRRPLPRRASARHVHLRHLGRTARSRRDGADPARRHRPAAPTERARRRGAG